MQQNWIVQLRALFTIAVIFIHVSAGVVMGTSQAFNWWAGNIYNSLGRFCLPVFVMITGALLIPKQEDAITFWRKRFIRVIVPFLFWSAIYLAFHFYTDYVQGRTITYISAIKFSFEFLLIGDSSAYHFWYIYTLIGLYLLLPVLKWWIHAATRKQLNWVLISWLLYILVAFPYLSASFPNVELFRFVGYLGYLILGFYLSTLPESGKASQTKLAKVATFMGVGLISMLTFGLSYLNQKIYLGFYDSFSFGVIIYGAGVLVWIKNSPIKGKIVHRFFNLISTYSFGIYLIHVLVLQQLSVLGISWKLLTAFLSVPIISLLCLIVSLFTVFVVSKLPLGNYFSGKN